MLESPGGGVGQGNAPHPQHPVLQHTTQFGKCRRDQRHAQHRLQRRHLGRPAAAQGGVDFLEHPAPLSVALPGGQHLGAGGLPVVAAAVGIDRQHRHRLGRGLRIEQHGAGRSDAREPGSAIGGAGQVVGKDEQLARHGWMDGQIQEKLYEPSILIDSIIIPIVSIMSRVIA